MLLPGLNDIACPGVSRFGLVIQSSASREAQLPTRVEETLSPNSNTA